MYNSIKMKMIIRNKDGTFEHFIWHRKVYKCQMYENYHKTRHIKHVRYIYNICRKDCKKVNQ